MVLLRRANQPQSLSSIPGQAALAQPRRRSRVDTENSFRLWGEEPPEGLDFELNTHYVIIYIYIYLYIFFNPGEERDGESESIVRVINYSLILRGIVLNSGKKKELRVHLCLYSVFA